MINKENLSYLLFIALCVLVILLLLTRVFGNSATDLQLMFTLFGAYLTGLINLSMRVGRNEEAVKRMEQGMHNGFTNVRKKIEKIEELIKRKK